MGEIRLERCEHWDWLRLQAGKANAIGPEFLEGLDREIDRLPWVDADAPARPLLITGEGSSFSAGLDLRTLIEFDRPRLTAFVRRFHGVFLRVACLQRPTVAAVNGHAVAGGAILAAACDVRIGVDVVAGTGKAPLLGVNEVVLGLPFPRSAAAILEHGLGGAQRALLWMLGGELVDPVRAQARGLLHAVVEAGELRKAAEAAALPLTAGTAAAVGAVKGNLTRRLVRLAAEEAVDDEFVDTWFSPGTQARLRQAVAGLRSR